MTDKEAIERLKYINMAYDCNNYYSRYDLDCIETALNLLQTQQAEIENKDKIIDLMSEQLTTPIHSKEWVKEYFERKVENGN